MSPAKAIVIGSGIAGLATAIRLSVKGYKVIVVERNDYAGGKIAHLDKNGYRFDTGPSLLTEPELIDQLFELSGECAENYFTYQRVTETCRYFFANGKVVHAYADPEKFARELECKVSEDPSRVTRYLERAAFAYQKIGKVFLENSPGKRQTWVNKKIFAAVSHTRTSYLFSSLNDFNNKQFTKPETVQLFNRFATYNGSDPYQSPAMLSMISHIEFNAGIYYPRGGMQAIAEALYKLALQKGVDFKFNCEAKNILSHNGSVTGVHTWDGIIGGIVVSNADVFYTYRDLLGDQKLANKLAKIGRSSSAIVFCWGIKKEFPQLHLHNIFFSKDYRKEFDCIFRKGMLSNDPTVYINITSKLEAYHAADGGENWFVMINAPSTTNNNAQISVQDARNIVIEKLNSMLKVNLEPLIEVEQIYGPSEIEKNSGAYGGSLYGTNSNSLFSAFMRHPNFSKKYRGLYFAGGTVHPGGGIPLCLKSAKIVSNLVPDL